MINPWKQAKAFYLRNKVSDFEYDCVRNEIYRTNLSILQVCSFVSMALFFILTILSAFFKDRDVFRTHVTYASMFLYMTAVFVVTLKLPESRKNLVMLLVYFFSGGFFAYTTLNGVFDKPNDYAVIFYVFQFASPLLLVDKARRIFGVNLIATFVFCVLTMVIKSPEHYKVDVFNAIVFYGLSILPGFYLTKIRVREFSLRQIIESERDTDELTGLLNKGALIREAKKNINATKNGILIIMDLDYFKQINDTYGHFTGDHVLKLVSICIKSIFRSSDVMGRFGGDEFVILMANTDKMDIALLRCNQLLEKLNSTKIFPDNPDNDTTIHASVGFAPYTNESDFDSLFKKSDQALYEAKNTGKDRACSFPGERF